LVGDRPAGVAADRAELTLLPPARDLDDAPVDVVVDLAAALLPGVTLLQGGVDGVVQGNTLADAEALVAKPLERLPVRADWQAVMGAVLIREDRERAAGGDGGILLAQRAGCRVAGIHERGQAGVGALLIDTLEAGQRQVDLAAHLDHAGLADLQRYGADG